MNWYYLDGSAQIGPLPDEEFENRVARGVVRQDTLVWREGMPEWRPLGEVDGASPVDSSRSPVETGSPAVGLESRVRCPTCGASIDPSDLILMGEIRVCPNCKAARDQRAADGGAAAQQWEYGEFWPRVVAALVDGAIMILAVLAIAVVFGLIVASRAADPEQMTEVMVVYQLVVTVFYYALWISYYVFFHGNPGMQASLGKKLVGLRVISADGSRVSYLRALGRCLANALNGFTFGLTYLIVAFDGERRGLHDFICRTRVIKR